MFQEKKQRRENIAYTSLSLIGGALWTLLKLAKRWAAYFHDDEGWHAGARKEEKEVKRRRKMSV